MEQKYLRHIPEGYLWCKYCELITPHSLRDGKKDKTLLDNYSCDICGYYTISYANCDRCGWEFDPDKELGPEIIKVKKHTDKCLKLQEGLKNDNENEEIKYIHQKEFDDCTCPEVDCYCVVNCWNYSERSITYHLDCYDAIEWSYEVICPICNNIFFVDDGNC